MPKALIQSIAVLLVPSLLTVPCPAVDFSRRPAPATADSDFNTAAVAAPSGTIGNGPAVVRLDQMAAPRATPDVAGPADPMSGYLFAVILDRISGHSKSSSGDPVRAAIEHYVDHEVDLTSLKVRYTSTRGFSLETMGLIDAAVKASLPGAHAAVRATTTRHPRLTIDMMTGGLFGYPFAKFYGVLMKHGVQIPTIQIWIAPILQVFVWQGIVGWATHGGNGGYGLVALGMVAVINATSLTHPAVFHGSHDELGNASFRDRRHLFFRSMVESALVIGTGFAWTFVMKTEGGPWLGLLLAMMHHSLRNLYAYHHGDVIDTVPFKGQNPKSVILIVEEYEPIRSIISDYLQLGGITESHDDFSAASGTEALEKMRQLEKEGRRLDLLITEINMHRFDGAELVRKTWEQHPTLSVLFQTNHPENIPRDWLNLPYVAVLRQSDMFENIAATIRKLLSRPRFYRVPPTTLSTLGHRAA